MAFSLPGVTVAGQVRPVSRDYQFVALSIAPSAVFETCFHGNWHRIRGKHAIGSTDKVPALLATAKNHSKSVKETTAEAHRNTGSGLWVETAKEKTARAGK